MTTDDFPNTMASAAVTRRDYDEFRRTCQALQRRHEAALELQPSLKRVIRGLGLDRLRRWAGVARRRLHARDDIYRSPAFKPYVMRIDPVADGAARPVVLHVIPGFGTGGSQRLIVDLAEGTYKQYDHRVVTRYAPDPPSYIGLPVREVDNRRSAAWWRKSLCRNRPALVHYHHYADYDENYEYWRWAVPLLDVAASLSIPMVQNVNVPVTPLAMPEFDADVFVSRTVLQRFAFDGRNNRVIYPGSALAPFRNLDRAPRENGTKCIGMVYRLDESKLRRESIEVILAVLRATENVAAMIIGDGYLLAEWKQRVASAGFADRVDFTGFVAYDRLPEYYARMDVFVAPVYRESFGQVTPFAMAAGVPVAAYAADALPEILDNLEQLAPVGDHIALTAVIGRLLYEPTDALIAAQRHRVERLFGVDVMVRDYSDLYGDILNKDRNPL